jgi:hypothetical protein
MAGYYGSFLGNEAGMNDMLAGSPSFDLNRRPGALGGRSGEQLKRLYEGGTRQNEKLNQELLDRGIFPGVGPQLPFEAFLPGSAGNLGALAQANPQFLPGPAAMLGPEMQMEMNPQFSVRPSVRIDNDQLNVGGRVNIPLGKADAFSVQGNYVPDENSLNIQGSLGKPPGQPGFGLDFGYTKNKGFPGSSYGMGRFSAPF